jgi:hypothetical protein
MGAPYAFLVSRVLLAVNSLELKQSVKASKKVVANATSSSRLIWGFKNEPKSAPLLSYPSSLLPCQIDVQEEPNGVETCVYKCQARGLSLHPLM